MADGDNGSSAAESAGGAARPGDAWRYTERGSARGATRFPVPPRPAFPALLVKRTVTETDHGVAGKDVAWEYVYVSASPVLFDSAAMAAFLAGRPVAGPATAGGGGGAFEDVGPVCRAALDVLDLARELLQLVPDDVRPELVARYNLLTETMSGAIKTGGRP